MNFKDVCTFCYHRKYKPPNRFKHMNEKNYRLEACLFGPIYFIRMPLKLVHVINKLSVFFINFLLIKKFKILILYMISIFYFYEITFFFSKTSKIS